MFCKIILSLFCFVAITVFLNSRCAATVLQERAVIQHCNPKYFTNCTAITKRVRRGEPYRTNVTATLLYPLYNNVTMSLLCDTKVLPNVLKIETKACDALKINWIKQFFDTYSTSAPVSCPLHGVMSMINIELPPKNFPLPLMKGETIFIASAFVTETKELMFEGHVILHKN